MKSQRKHFIVEIIAKGTNFKITTPPIEIILITYVNLHDMHILTINKGSPVI